MFVENLEDVPESLRDQFVESELDGKKGYQDKDSFELKKHLFNVKEENKQIKESKSSIESQLNQFKEQESEKIEAAKRQVLEDAKKDGKSNEALELLQQELDDMRQRNDETKSQYEKRIEDMTNSISVEKNNSFATDIVSEIGNVKGSKYLKKIILERVHYDPETGKRTILDENGGATSLDKAGFIAELKKDEDIHPLLKADIVTNGGGLVNGSNGQKSVGDTSKSKAAQEAKEKGDLSGFLKASLNFNT